MKPFRDYKISDIIQSKINAYRKKIDSFPNEIVMENDIDILTESVFQEFCIDRVEIGTEDCSQRKTAQRKFKKYVEPFYRDPWNNSEYIEVDGIAVSFFYQFKGDPQLFQCQGSTVMLSPYPEIFINNNYLVLEYIKSIPEMEKEKSGADILKQRDHDLKEICSGVGYVNSDVDSYNKSLRNDIKNYISQKKKKVQVFYSVSKQFEIPVQKNEYASKFIPLQRQIIPLSTKRQSEHYYCISDESYNDILSTIKHTASTYERTPKSYRQMEEEDLRNTLLAALNGTYKGDANGEAFRNHGKTDICIEQENRAAFVAECKMWKGQKQVEDAVMQLDSYLTWRDTKAALIFFVRNVDFFSIIEKAKKALVDINGVTAFCEVDKNEFSCKLQSKTNVGQYITIRIFLFNLHFD